MKSINRKLNDIENNVLQNPIHGTTMICSCGFPEPEQVLLEKARQISEMGIPYADATDQQKAIIAKAGKILRFRVCDLFTMYLDTWCQDDPIVRVVIHERFLWFITELRKEIQQQLEVSEIEKNASEEDEVDKVDEYFRKAPELYTPESYDKLTTDLMVDWMKDMKAQGKWKDIEKKLLGKVKA